MSRTMAVPVMLLAFAACARDSAAPTARVAGVAAATNNGVGVELQVNGAGLVDLPDPFGDMKFQFVAKRKGDGSVNGHFRFTRQNPDGLIDFEGDVTCVTSDANFPGRARIGGIVTGNNSTSPGSLTLNHQVGDDVWFRVQDNGNGSAAAPDRVTVLGFAPVLVDTSADYCALPFADGPFWSASIFPVVNGALRVNP